MKRKIIGLTLTAAMLAATAQTAFAGYYLQSDPFESTGTQFTEKTAATYDGRKIWKLDGSDNYKYNDSGIVSEKDIWFSGRGAYTNSNKTGLFDRGWLPNDENTQSIILSTGIDDAISTYDDFKAAKYANATRKGADMCEWNGYLFVLMNAPMTEVTTADKKVVCTNKRQYLDDGAVYAAQQSDGTWAQTDIEGNYLLDDNGEKIILESYTKVDSIKKNSSQIQVYDITNGGKEYVAEWDCQNDLGINCDTKLGADYLTVGLDVTDDYIYCYTAPRGRTGSYGTDANWCTGLAVFKNTIDRETGTYDIPTRIKMQGEESTQDITLLSAGIVNTAYHYDDGFRHFIIGNKMLVFSNVNQAYAEKNPTAQTFIIDTSAVGEKTVSITRKAWQNWLNYTIPDDCTVNSNLTLKDFYVDGNFGYALIQYQTTGGSYCYTFKKYDISNLENPVEISEAKHTTSLRKASFALTAVGGYLYAVLSDYNKDVDKDETVILVYDAKNTLVKKQEIHPILSTQDCKSMGVTTFTVIGNWIYASFNSGGNAMTSYEYFFKLSDDKTELLDSYTTISRLGLPGSKCILYGQRLYISQRGGPGIGIGSPHTLSRVTVLDMKNANAVDLKLDKVPAQVKAPYTLTGKLAGANMDGDVFQITVNDQEPIYVTYDELEYVDDDYWAKFNYSVTEPGDYTITVAPMSIDSEPIMGAAETVSFTVLPNEVPNELKLTADYSSEIGQGTLSVTPKVTNNIGKGAVSGTPIAALYKDGVLVEAKSGAVQTVEDGAYQKALTSINLTVPADTDYSQYNVKVFLFESLNNIKPITNSVSYR